MKKYNDKENFGESQSVKKERQERKKNQCKNTLVASKNLVKKTSG